MTPQDVEIIKAKHGHGLTPAVIARQLEMPAREVAKVTGRLPITKKVTADNVRATMAGRRFTGVELADALCVESALANSSLLNLERRGVVQRVGKEYINCRHVTVWRLRGE